jgi:type III secretion protein L
MAKVIKKETTNDSIPRPATTEAGVLPPKPRPATSASTSSAAENEAKRIIARAQHEAMAHAQALEAAVAEKMADARQQGIAAGRQASAPLMEGMAQLAGALKQEAEPAALEVAEEVARRMFAEEIQQFPETIVDIVRRALMSSRQQRENYVRVHPSHIDMLRTHKREIVDVLGRAKDIDIREDAELSPGGCVIETEIGTVDARFDVQFAALSHQLRRGGR